MITDVYEAIEHLKTCESCEIIHSDCIRCLICDDGECYGIMLKDCTSEHIYVIVGHTYFGVCDECLDKMNIYFINGRLRDKSSDFSNDFKMFIDRIRNAPNS